MSGRVNVRALGLLLALLVVGAAAGLYFLQRREEPMSRAERLALFAKLAAELPNGSGPSGAPARAREQDPEIAPEVAESEYPRIIADLMKHPELIPAQPVLGGTIFFVEGQIRVLGPKWVVAPFEDGHIAGVALLRYRLESSGEIRWEVLDSYLM